MFGLVMAVFFAWSREKRADGGLGWLESARRSNFATLVSSHQEASEGPGPAATAATAGRAATATKGATAGKAGSVPAAPAVQYEFVMVERAVLENAHAANSARTSFMSLC